MKFADAQKKMLDYLSSDEFKSREDAESTVASVPILQTIVRNGFLTDNSQEGVVSSGFNPESQRYYRIEERAYVTGFMKPEIAQAFLNHLNGSTDKVGFVIQEDESKAFEETFFKGAHILSYAIPVTVQGSATTKSQVKATDPFTRLSTRLPRRIVHFQKKQVQLNAKDTAVYVAVFDPKYGRKATGSKGLYEDILASLKK